MIGRYDVNAAGRQGYEGVPVEVTDAGNKISRQLTSADVVQTAVAAMGIQNAFIPGGSAEIVGVRET